MAASDLTNLKRAKEWVGAKTAADDALLGWLITRVSDWIGSYCNRRFDIRSYSEVRDGLGSRTMILRAYPVAELLSLRINGATVGPRPAVGQPGYLVSDGRIITLYGGLRFFYGEGNVEVTYTAGYPPDAIPPDIEQACLELVAERYRYKDRTGHQAIVAEGQNIIFRNEDMPKFVATNLNSWRNTVPV